MAGDDNVQPLWVPRHFDSVYSVAITEAAVYVGGHFGFQESPTAPDPWPGLDDVGYGTGQGLAGYGLGDAVVRREHVGALSPADGKALEWNPGAFTFEGNKAMEATPPGLFVGGDGQYKGGKQTGRVAFFDFNSVPAPSPIETTIVNPIVDVDRDLTVARWADLREVAAGEPCPRCGRPLELLRAIEVGHIFKLGSRYPEALGLSVLGPDGNRVAPVMGSYGIGVERAMAAIVERHHDAAGIVWPVQVAPFAVAILVLDPGDPDLMKAADALQDRLAAAGVDVLVDDRAERPGVKFRDAELIGFPVRLTLGARDFAGGTVELARRDTGERERLPIGAAAERVLGLVGPPAAGGRPAGY